MSSILEELKKKRAEEGKSYLDISTKNDYSSVEKADKERQEQLKVLEEAVAKLRTPYIDYKEKPSTIQSISLEDESFSRPAGDTIQSNQGGVTNVSLIDAGKAAAKGAETVAKAVAPVVKNEIKTTKDIIVSDVAKIRAGLKTFSDENQALALAKLDADKLLKYAKGEKGILNTLEFNRLKNSNKTKTIPAVAVMADEISRGTYKGTVEDIRKILKQGDDQAYTIWYNRNVAPFVNKAQQSANANTSMYGETAGNVMNTVANIGAKGLEFLGLSNVAGPIAAGGALGFSEGSSKIVPKVQSGYAVEEASRDIVVDTAKGAAFVALFQAASPILNKGISPSVTGVQRAAQSMVNGFLTATGVSLGTQALDLLKKDPDFDFIDWNEFEAGAKSGKYKDLQDYMNSDAFAKHVAGDRAAQVLVSATVASLFNTYNVMKNMSINENRLVTAKEAAKFNPKRATYLKTLGLNEGATDEEIQAAFRRLSRELYVGGTVAPENLERWYAIVEAKNGLLPKEVLNTMVRTNTQPQQQTTSSVVPVNNTPTTVARPTQQATVVPPPSTTLPPLTNTTNNNIINPNQGGVINGQTNNQGVVENVGLAANDNRGNIRSLQGQAIGEGPSRGNDMVSGRGETAVGQEGTIDDTKPSKEQETLTLGEFDRLINLYERLIEKDGENGHYQKAIEILKEGKEKWSSLDFTPKAAIERTADGLGTTEKFETAGFVLPDGRMTDLSGSKFGLSGKTRLNHYMVLPFSGYLRDDFIKETGSIRVYPEGGSVDISETVPPTEEQLKVLEKYFNYSKSLQSSRKNALGDYFYVDIMRKNRPNISFEIQKDIPSSTFIDILKDYFKTGKRPDDYNTYISEPDNLEYTIQNSTQGSFSMPKNLPEELPESKRKFLKDLKSVGYINVNGVKIESIEDMADLAQVFRDPTVETFRGVFMKDGVVVTQSAFSANDARKVPINSTRFINWAERVIAQTGANELWITHNHPDANASASGGDKGFTKKVGDHFRGTGVKFRGQVVIDHNEYAYISPSGNATDHIKLKEKTYNEVENNFSKEAWTNVRLFGNKTWGEATQKIASLASLVRHSPDISTMILATNWGDARIIQSLPNEFFSNPTKKIKDYAKELASKNGATTAFYATTDPDTYTKMVARVGSSAGIVLYEPGDDGSLKILKSTRVGNYMLYSSKNSGADIISPGTDEQLNGPQTSLEEIKKQYEPKQPEVKKEPPKKLEPPKKKEQPAKAEKKQPAKRLEKKQPEPDKRLGFDAVDKDKEALEKANDKLRDELAKQKKEYEERLKKKDEALEKFKQTKKEQKEKQKLKLKKKEEQKKEEQRFKSATPKGKLRMLGRKIEKQTGYYEISDYPKLDELYEKEFGKTIRQTIQTLKTRDIYPYLPAKFQDIVNTFADETYLKANWKTFDKYVKEALQIKELKDLVEKSDTPVAKRLLSVMQEHKSAPITIKNAKEMYDDLQILADIVELAQERLDYRRQPENWEKILDKSAEALEELEKANTPKKLTPKSAKRERKFDNFKKLPETFQTLKTRIQAAFGGNPNSPLKTVWDWFEEGREREAMLDSKFAENFDGLVEKAAGGWKFAGELEKDFAEDAPYVDTGITGTNPKTGKPYEENAKLPRDIIMHIVASSKNDDNLMSFCKILLGTDYQGNPVYSNPGGYIVPNEYYMKRGKIGEAYEKGKKYVFTKKDIEHLEGMLTETEKKFVEAALRVGDITAQYGNEVSQKLIGRDLFSVKNYIRIIRDLSTFDGELIDPTQLDNLANATSDKYVGIGGILGRGGSLEGRNHRSTRPIYGESLKQSVENSFGGAKKYIAYALPLYDTDFILEGRLPDTFEQVEVVDKEPKSTASLKYVKVDEPPRNGADRTMYYVDNGDGYTVYKVAEKGKTMRQLLTNAGEEGFYDYYKQFVDGLVGRNKKYSKFASTRARVVLNANLRVAATQFFSYFQMGQFLNYPTSSMTKALADKGTIFKLAKEFLESKNVDTSKLKGQRLVNRFIEYATYTNTQRGLGKFSDDVRYVEAGSTVLGRINAGKLLAAVDKFTVDATFRALMYDIMADGTKFGSEEFFKQFKSRLYSIYQSNPQYSAIYRTPIQNKGTAISTALSQFQTVMLQGFNNASQAAMAHEYYKRQGNEKEKKKWGKIFKRTVSGLIISSLTLIALRDYLDQLAGKEKDEPYVKRITMSFIQNMLSYTIVGDEIFSALFKFNDYDLTTNELSYFNTALDTIGDMGTLVTKPTPPNAIKLIKSLGQTLGLPTGSLENTFGILSNLTPGNAFRAYSVFKDSSKYERWLKNQDAIGTDFKTFYEISQAVKEKTLKEKYGYVEHSETDTYGSLSYAKGRAIMDVLGIEQGKKMTKEQKQAYSKWYNIFKD